MTGMYHISTESFRPRDEWLPPQLLAQVQRLVTQLEALGGLPSKQQVAFTDLETLCKEPRPRPAEPRRPLP
jgi:hypothetical protein